MNLFRKHEYIYIYIFCPFIHIGMAQVANIDFHAGKGPANIMAADVLATQITKSSAAVVLTKFPKIFQP